MKKLIVLFAVLVLCSFTNNNKNVHNVYQTDYNDIVMKVLDIDGMKYAIFCSSSKVTSGNVLLLQLMLQKIDLNVNIIGKIQNDNINKGHRKKGLQYYVKL